MSCTVPPDCHRRRPLDRKSTRLNSSHLVISYAVFCLKKKELNCVAGENADLAENLWPLEEQLAKLRAEIYRNLTPMQRVSVARHPLRAYLLDYVNAVF